MTDLHQMLCRSQALLISVDVRKNLPGRKLNRLLVKRLLSSKNLENELNITFSKILEQIGSKDTGR